MATMACIGAIEGFAPIYFTARVPTSLCMTAESCILRPDCAVDIRFNFIHSTLTGTTTAGMTILILIATATAFRTIAITAILPTHLMGLHKEQHMITGHPTLQVTDNTITYTRMGDDMA